MGKEADTASSNAASLRDQKPISILAKDKDLEEGGPGSGRYPKGSGDDKKGNAPDAKASSNDYTPTIPSEDLKDALTKLGYVVTKHNDKVTKDLSGSAIISKAYKAQGKNAILYIDTNDKGLVSKSDFDRLTKSASDYNSGIPATAGQLWKTQKQSSERRLSQAEQGHAYTKVERKLEAKTQIGKGTKFEVVLIQEGLGNLKDCFYYTKEALKTSAEIFEGKKIYADHPDAMESQLRPERSVKSIIGCLQNIRYEESDDGRGMLIGEAHMVEDASVDWAKSLMSYAIDYSKKYTSQDFVGMSINAFGDAEKQSVEEFLKENKIPESVMPKIQEALAQGIDELKVTTRLTDAISVDLVTDAGAGGRILKMLEAARPKPTGGDSMEDEKKEQAPVADGKNAGHDDAEQDKALIMDMIKKHLKGDEEQEPSEEECKQAHEAYEAYKEMGYKEEEAIEAMKHAAKLAKHRAAKSAEASTDKALGTQQENESEKDSKESEKKENDVLALTAKVAFLEGELKKERLQKHVDKTLQESKLPRSATKKFLETAKDFKSNEDFDSKFAIFREAFKEANKAQESEPFGFILSAEKSAAPEKDDSMSFADCVK